MHWVEMIKKTARFNEVSDVSGILNGTCNYMLDHMERSGLSFEEALARAQALGYAEADPTADITAPTSATRRSSRFACLPHPRRGAIFRRRASWA